MAHSVTPKPSLPSLGPGFWPFTAALAVYNAVSIWWIWAQNFSDWLPEAAAPADQIDSLFKALAILGTVVFQSVTGYLLYFAVVFRRRKTDLPDAIGSQVHDVPMLEVVYWVVPILLVIIIGAFSVQIWAGLQHEAGGAMTMEAVGHQFYFEARYPGLAKPVANVIHVPLGVPITMHVSSADVIHGFWVPEDRVKMDMVPGLINTIRFKPSHVGTYRIVCTEFCGIAHGAMKGQLIVEPRAQFESWLASQKQAQAASATAAGPNVAQGNASAGKTLFDQKCTVCHNLAPFDQKKVGPGLANLAHDPAHPTLVTGKPPTPANIADILKNGFTGPIGTMPSAQANNISDKDIADLVAYLLSVSK